MRIIKKVWVRILISLFAGALFSELMDQRTGNYSVETSNKYVYFFGIITYILLTVLIWGINYLKYWKGYSSSNDNHDNDDILDN
jgi:uncharacterized membrane protein YozB (DUF420 family)